MRWGVVAVGVVAVGVLVGCGKGAVDVPWQDDNTTPTPTATHIAIVSGDGQSARTGETLPEPLVVEVREPSSGDPIPGMALVWETDRGTLTPDGYQATLELETVAHHHNVTVSLQADPSVSAKLSADGVPTVLTLEPRVALPGTTLTITGDGFSSTPANNLVTFGTTDVSAANSDLATLTLSAPDITDPADTVVTVNGVASPDLLKFATFRDRSAAGIAGTSGCNLFDASTSRNVAMGPDLTLYVAAECAAGGAVLVSFDGGVTFEPQVAISNNANDIAIQATDIPGVVFVGWIQGGNAHVAVSTDYGATFGASAQVASNRDRVSLAWDANTLYLGAWQAEGAGDWTVRASADLGQTWPVNTTLNMPTAYGDLVIDRSTGNLYVVADDPDLHLRESTDGGQSFGVEQNPMGQVHYSDWQAGAGLLYVASEDGMLVIDLSTGVSDNITGEASAATSGNALYVDDAGNAFLVTDSGGITLERILAGTTNAQPPLQIDGAGGNPSVVVSASGAVAVAYERGGQIYFATVVF